MDELFNEKKYSEAYTLSNVTRLYYVLSVSQKGRPLLLLLHVIVFSNPLSFSYIYEGPLINRKKHIYITISYFWDVTPFNKNTPTTPTTRVRTIGMATDSGSRILPV